MPVVAAVQGCLRPSPAIAAQLVHPVSVMTCIVTDCSRPGRCDVSPGQQLLTCMRLNVATHQSLLSACPITLLTGDRIVRPVSFHLDETTTTTSGENDDEEMTTTGEEAH